VDQEAENATLRDAPARQALRMETRGLILIALVVLVVYLARYFHLLQRSTP
jgi:hypothetical protein